MKFPRKYLLALTILLTLAACTKDDGGQKPKDPSEHVTADNAGGGGVGGMDAGGGNTNTSTAFEVEDAIKKAFDLASETDWPRNVFVRFWLEEAQHVGNFPGLAPTLFPNLPLPEPFLNNGPEYSENMRIRLLYLRKTIEGDPAVFESPILRVLKSRPLTLLEKGDCLVSEDKHADASVSSFDSNASLCFSVGNLTKVAPSALLQEILSLVLHEAVHMGGAAEEEAQIWQKRFSEYFFNRFAQYNEASFFEMNAQALTEIQDLAISAEELNEKYPGDPKVYLWMGQLEQHLVKLPFRFDPLALRLVANPQRPDLVNNYVNSLLKMTQKMNRVFDFSSRERSVEEEPPHQDREPFAKRDPKQMQKDLRELANLSTAVFDNWLLFVGGIGRSRCVLPDEPLDSVDLFLNIGDTREFWMIKPILPPRKCDSPGEQPSPKSSEQ